MENFTDIVLSFPTVIFTFCFFVCIFYWIVVALGLIDLDIVDIEIPDADDGGSNILAGLLARFGLSGVPFPIIFSLLTIIGWVTSYYLVFFIEPLLPFPWLTIIAEILFFLFAFCLSSWLTGLIVKPLRPFFEDAQQVSSASFVGKSAIVRTSTVNQEFGEANLNDGGAGLIVKVRAYKDSEFSLGDEVVLIEYDESQGFYKVVSPQEFKPKQ